MVIMSTDAPMHKHITGVIENSHKVPQSVKLENEKPKPQAHAITRTDGRSREGRGKGMA